MKKQSLQLVICSISFLYAPTLHCSLGQYLKDKAAAFVMRHMPISYKVDYFLRQQKKMKLLETERKGPIITEPDDSPRDTSSYKREPLLFPTHSWQPHYNTIDVPAIIATAKENCGGPVSITINLHHENTQHATIGKQDENPATEAIRRESKKVAIPWYQQAAHACTDITQWVRLHKWTVAGSCIAVAYLGIQAALIHLRWSLNKEIIWSSWKKQCTLEELYRISQQNLVQDLIATLQEPHKEKRFLTISLKQCIKEIDQEISALKRYRSLTSLLDRYLLRKLFFYDERLIEESNDRIQRLLFIRGTACAAMQTITPHSYDTLFTHAHTHQSA